MHPPRSALTHEAAAGSSSGSTSTGGSQLLVPPGAQDAAAPSTRGRAGPAALAAHWPVALLGAVVGVLQFLVVRGSLVDDAYITMTYARNVAFDLHWGLLSDVTSNTATSPFFVMVLAAATAVVRSPVVALGVVTVASYAVLGVALDSIAQRTGLPRLVAPLALVLLLVNPVLLSSAGLETLLLITLLGCLAAAGVSGRLVLFGLVAGALVLTRVESGVFIAALALGLGEVRRRMWVSILAALAVVLPWYAFSWVALGSAIPDTLLLKQDQTWGPWNFANGPQLYYDVYPVATLMGFAVPAVGLLLAVVVLVATLRRAVSWTASGPWLLLALGAVGVYFAYSRLVVPPYHWYYGAAIGALSMVAAGSVGVLLRLRPHGSDAVRAGRAWWLGPAAAGAVGLLALMSAGFVLGRGGAWEQAAISTNWAAPAEYLAIGEDLREDLPEGSRLQSPGEIGTLVYACDCVVDQFSDPDELRPVIEERIAESEGLGRWLLDLNYRNLPPAGEGVPVDYALRYVRGAVPVTDQPPAVWGVASAWQGEGTLETVPVEDAGGELEAAG